MHVQLGDSSLAAVRGEADNADVASRDHFGLRPVVVTPSIRANPAVEDQDSPRRDVFSESRNR